MCPYRSFLVVSYWGVCVTPLKPEEQIMVKLGGCVLEPSFSWGNILTLNSNHLPFVKFFLVKSRIGFHS
jgi:hypothetical protein